MGLSCLNVLPLPYTDDPTSYTDDPTSSTDDLALMLEDLLDLDAEGIESDFDQEYSE